MAKTYYEKVLETAPPAGSPRLYLEGQLISTDITFNRRLAGSGNRAGYANTYRRPFVAVPETVRKMMA